MKTEIIKEKIYSKHYNGFPNIRYKDLPIDVMKENDIVSISREDGYYSENNSWDSFTMVEIFRERPETDEETTKRQKEWGEYKKESRKKRYERYLILRDEFEIK